MGYSEIFEQWSASTRGRRYIQITGVVVLGLTGYGLFFKNKKKAKKQQKEGKSVKSKGKSTQLLRESLSKRILLKAGLACAVLGARSVAGSHINDQIGLMGELTVKRQWTDCFDQCLTYAISTFGNSCLGGLQTYLHGSLAHDLRVAISARSQAALARSNLARLRDRPGAARILTQDVMAYSDKMVDLFLGIVKPTIDILYYTHKLRRRLGGLELSLCFSYFIGSYCWAQLCLPSKKQINLRLEGEEDLFLAEHERIIGHGEEIEFLQGRLFECARLEAALGGLSRARRALRLQHLVSDVFSTYFTRYGGVLVCFLAMLPTLQRTDRPTEIFLQSLHDLVNMGLGFRDGFSALKTRYSISALAERIDALLAQIGGAEVSAGRLPRGAPRALAAEALSIAAPGGAPLFENCKFCVQNKERVLIIGKNGAGKTSFFRVAAGLWPPSRGAVAVSPGAYFLPQQPYLVPGLSVRAQLCYPDDSLLDDRLQTALTVTGFFEIVGAKTLDEVLDWKSLSPGQKQVTSIARLIAHNPKTVFLDEPNNHLNGKVTESFFSHLKKEETSVIAISHDLTLRDYFTSVWTIESGSMRESFPPNSEKENFAAM